MRLGFTMILQRILFCLALFLPCSAAHSESLEQLAQRSAFVSAHYNWLKAKGAQSAYASEDYRCPSLYWVSFKASAKNEAERKWEREISRRMSSVGFPQETIHKCVASGAFVYNSMELTRHKKNSSYKRGVEGAVAVYTEIGSGIVNTLPLTVETYRRDTTKRLKAYDAKLADFCNFDTQNNTAFGTCKRFGKLSGQFSSKSDRTIIRLENDKWKVVVFTGRDRNYALRNF